MKARVSPVVMVVMAAAIWFLVGNGPARAQAGPPVVVKVLAQSSSWKLTPVELRRGQVAEIRASGTWFINPLWSQQFGAGGHPELPAASEYALEGANEGSLLVAVGDKVVAFTKDRQTLKVSGPGRIAMMANDAYGERDHTTTPGMTKIAGLPVDGSGKDRSGGYVDNHGALKVTISVKEGR